MTSTTENSSVALPAVAGADWLLRLPLAATFLYHGVTKFPNIAAGAEFMGLPFVVWLAVALGEIAVGAGIVAGALIPSRLGDVATRASGAGIAVIMIGAIALVHWGQWSALPSESHPVGGMEFQVLLLAAGVFFALRGNRA